VVMMGPCQKSLILEIFLVPRLGWVSHLRILKIPTRNPKVFNFYTFGSGLKYPGLSWVVPLFTAGSEACLGWVIDHLFQVGSHR